MHFQATDSMKHAGAEEIHGPAPSSTLWNTHNNNNNNKSTPSYAWVACFFFSSFLSRLNICCFFNLRETGFEVSKLAFSVHFSQLAGELLHTVCA